MKVSEVTLQDVKDSTGYSSNRSDALFNIYMDSALAFIVGYTGLTPEEIDTHEDITTAYMCLVGDMFANRYTTVENDKLNPTVKQILSLYAINYL